ncbi:DUF4259 domain-containing protein [Kitasatospora indigofera]|uniref:DUF4259 domain-containing protein n=1 Tax=Kitasatospora indigofera TaxID=67307 RepID=UPI00365D1FAB
MDDGIVMVMNQAARTAWWESLPAGIQAEIDGYVLQDSILAAVHIIVAIGLVPHDTGVGTAQMIANDRYRHYGDRIAREPESPLDLESLACRAAGCAVPVLAIEAVRDGDSITTSYGPDKALPRLATDLRALAAEALGRVLAADSELAELWDDSGEGPQWRQGIGHLRAVLDPRPGSQEDPAVPGPTC